jgi:F0F1-type ATP synthase assembly protein I
MDKRPKNDQKEKQRQSLNTFTRFSGMAFQIAAPIILGVLAGGSLDKHYPMKFPVYTTVLTIAGVFLGIYIVIRSVLKNK